MEKTTKTITIYEKTFTTKDGRKFKKQFMTFVDEDGEKAHYEIHIRKTAKEILKDIKLPCSVSITEEDYFITCNTKEYEGKSHTVYTVVLLNCSNPVEVEFEKRTLDNIR